MKTFLEPDDTFRNAACVGLPVDEFYPKPSQSTDGPKRTCTSCPVRDACLQHALEHNERYGIWGGTTPEERRDLTKGTTT
jgi:WhiB family redox-sensing transcriptional regulator